ncbi:DUF4326 domain-containing protein [Blastomonas sp.]|uniref:DUF4326 domain-containing protein n=1 Tax=Blastomonas sp. TaxID=1909299 RepID=UPI00391CB2BE
MFDLVPSPFLDNGGCAPVIKAGVPRRSHRKRGKGTITPPGVIYVGRPTVYSNPFDSRRFGHARSVALYRCWTDNRLGALALGRLGFCPVEIEALGRLRQRLHSALPRLIGMDLQCWCPLTSRWCHADVLLELANRESFTA